MGHTSTSVSLACGMAKARDLKAGDSYRVVAVVGDGSLSGGLAFEGPGQPWPSSDRRHRYRERQRLLHRREPRRALPQPCRACARPRGERPQQFLPPPLGLDYRFLADGNDEAAARARPSRAPRRRPPGGRARVHHQGRRLRARRRGFRKLAPRGAVRCRSGSLRRRSPQPLRGRGDVRRR